VRQESIIEKAARASFYKAGGLQAARWLHRKSLRILMYHRFSDPEPLARQCAHLRKHYSPVSLLQVADWLEGGAPLPANAVAITIDDGYRDFYQVAHPVFRKYGIPVTIYLVSGFLDRDLWLWVDQVRYAFLNSPRQNAVIEMPGRAAKSYDLSTRENRMAGATETTEAAKRIPNADRLAWMECLPHQLGISWPAEPPAEHAALHWEEAREMAGRGVEVGAHTCTHPILSRLAHPGEVLQEVAGSKLRIEEQLDRPVIHFCYPNGGRADIGAVALESVRQANFRTAVTCEVGVIGAQDDHFQLRRIGVEPGLDPWYFERCAAAFRV
jgi:peptidoglycan/xylan/chitin deacetylase (PgdA/CDA1 family)